MVRIFNLEAPLVHQANKTCPRSYASKKTRYVNTSAGGALPGTASESTGDIPATDDTPDGCFRVVNIDLLSRAL